MGESMDLFFDVWLYLKNDYYLSRWVRISLPNKTEIRIYSGNDLIIKESHEDLDLEYCYLLAALHLAQWAQRNECHASRSTEFSWLDKLKEKLGDEIDNAAEGWQLLSVHEADDGLLNEAGSGRASCDIQCASEASE